MNVKLKLEQIGKLENRIEKKLYELEEIKANAYGISAGANDKERVASTKDPDKIGNAVIRIMEKSAELDALIDTLSDLKNILRAQICLIPYEKYQEILFMHYFEHKSIYAIAEELKMSDRGVKKAHKRALEELEKAVNPQHIEPGVDSSPQDMVI